MIVCEIFLVIVIKGRRNSAKKEPRHAYEWIGNIIGKKMRGGGLCRASSPGDVGFWGSIGLLICTSREK